MIYMVRKESFVGVLGDAGDDMPAYSADTIRFVSEPGDDLKDFRE